MAEQPFDDNTILRDLRAEDLNLLTSLLSPGGGFIELTTVESTVESSVESQTRAEAEATSELLREIQGIDNLNMQQNPTSTVSASSLSPSATGAHPPTHEFGGEFGFQICLDALTKSSASNSWIYSESLKQVFIKMNHVLNVQFTTSKPLGQNHVIRALLVYQNNDYVNHPVNRCSIHWFEDDPLQRAHSLFNKCSCETYNWAGHVLRCQTNGALYQFDPQSERHSVTSPVSSSGAYDLVSLHYYFACKTSCPRGMQRRSIQIIFTLEDQMCRVIGRRVLPVKICSCPKRDRDRLEKDLRSRFQVDVPPPKRFRPESSNDLSSTNSDMPPATRESLEAAIVEKFKLQEKELSSAVGLIMNCQLRQGQIQELVKDIRKKLMSHE